MISPPALRAGTGSALPPLVLRNDVLERQLGLDPGWIEQRTGILERRVAADGEGVSTLAIRAGAVALQAAAIEPRDVGLLVLATSTPDRLLPPTAPLVADALGLRCTAFDLAAACSGFVHALGVAHAQLASGMTRAALIIGANVLSRRVNPDDASTAPIFGDGAGALALQVVSGDEPGARVLAVVGASDGSQQDLIHIPAGGSRQPLSAALLAERAHLMRMPAGETLFRVAVHAMADAAREAMRVAGVADVAAIDWLLAHQANARMVRRVAAQLGVPPARVLGNVDRVGNTSAASLPILLHESVAAGRVVHGQRLLLTAAGSGLTSGAAVLQW
ncbi:MAG: 3-oxoacyl-ACP synthase III family protein [Planctomycetota bacterium]